MNIVISNSSRFSIKRRLVNVIFAAVAEGQKQLTILSTSKENSEIESILNNSNKAITLSIPGKKIYLIKDLFVELILIDKSV